MTYFCVSDVHGFYDEMIKALENAGYDLYHKNHIFVSCGDLLDRGPKPLECLEFVNYILPNRKILIRGNHEDLMEELIQREYPLSHDIHNGTYQTIIDITQDKTISGFYKMSNNQEWLKYINSCIDYYELNNYIFVHGWVPYDSIIDDKTYTVKDTVNLNGDWKQARWENPFHCWSKGVRIPDKYIVCGHWHTSYGHCHYHNDGSEFGKNSNFDIFKDDGIIALDACTIYSGKVNVIKIEIEGEK